MPWNREPETSSAKPPGGPGLLLLRAPADAAVLAAVLWLGIRALTDAQIWIMGACTPAQIGWMLCREFIVGPAWLLAGGVLLILLSRRIARSR